MKNYLIKFIFSLLLVCSFNNTFFSQNKKTKRLKAKAALLKKQVKETKKLINKTRNSKRTTLSELRIINNQISHREELLINLNNQIKELNNQIENNQTVINNYKIELKKLKKEFREMIKFAYKNRKKEYNVMYLFSSKDYNEAFRRAKYIEQYSKNRKIKSIKINDLKEKLTKENNVLVLNMEEKKGLVSNYQVEKQEFVGDKEKQQSILVKIKSNQNSLQEKLTKQRQEKTKIAQAIKREIRKELERELARKKTKKNSPKVTTEIQLISKDFEKNKGRLPWPVIGGSVTKRFGRQRHSIVKSTFVNNDGIGISITKGASVRVVFEGKVTSILTIPGGGKAVIVGHGNYRTVYSNLKTVSVEIGQKLKTKQMVGTLLPDPSGQISECDFTIWKTSANNLTSVNPSIWLAPR